MKDFFLHVSTFTKTRFILTGWYTLILFLILVMFSLALSVTYNNDVTRIVLQQDFGNHVPRTLSVLEMRVVVAQVRELRNISQLDIIVIDTITIILGSGLSFFLAGKTLKPIQKSLAVQKLFVADASHELKSPVATIQSACEVVLRSSNKTKEDYKAAIEIIYGQSLQLGKLINDLLSLSVLDAGTSRPFQQCSLTTIVEKELEAIGPLAKKSKLTVQKNITPNVSIFADPDKVHQLVILLLDNAIKYTPNGGKITVSVKNKPIPQLIVQDTGIGIALEKQKDIFHRFYQTDVSHAGKGAGLGLAIGDSIMKLHKGRITVISSLGKGSIFTCVFPKDTS